MTNWPFEPLSHFGFDVIVADPPWLFELYSEEGEEKSAAAHYSLMSIDKIKALPVGHLARADCLLLLWTTGWAMATGQAQAVSVAWGFKPITEIVWRKTTTAGKVRMGPGYRARTMHEPILLCTLGKPIHKPFPSLFDGVAREHSRKPEEFYDMVLRCTENALRRADLFSRATHDGFSGWGNEHGKFDRTGDI
mgnify:CR=1 FL=1